MDIIVNKAGEKIIDVWSWHWGQVPPLHLPRYIKEHELWRLFESQNKEKVNNQVVPEVFFKKAEDKVLLKRALKCRKRLKFQQKRQKTKDKISQTEHNLSTPQSTQTDSTANLTDKSSQTDRTVSNQSLNSTVPVSDSTNIVPDSLQLNTLVNEETNFKVLLSTLSTIPTIMPHQPLETLKHEHREMTLVSTDSDKESNAAPVSSLNTDEYQTTFGFESSIPTLPPQPEIPSSTEGPAQNLAEKVTTPSTEGNPQSTVTNDTAICIEENSDDSVVVIDDFARVCPSSPSSSSDVVFLSQVTPLDRAIKSILSPQTVANSERTLEEAANESVVSVDVDETIRATQGLEKILNGNEETEDEGYPCRDMINFIRLNKSGSSDSDGLHFSSSIRKRKSSTEKTDMNLLKAMKYDKAKRQNGIPNQRPPSNQRIFKFYPPKLEAKKVYVTDMKPKMLDNIGTDLSFLTPDFFSEALQLKPTDTFQKELPPITVNYAVKDENETNAFNYIQNEKTFQIFEEKFSCQMKDSPPASPLDDQALECYHSKAKEEPINWSDEGVEEKSDVFIKPSVIINDEIKRLRTTIMKEFEATKIEEQDADLKFIKDFPAILPPVLTQSTQVFSQDDFKVIKSDADLLADIICPTKPHTPS